MPIRIMDQTKTQTDHIYVTSKQYIAEVCAPDYGTSDNYPICLTWYKKCTFPKIGHKKINYRYFSNFNEQDFLFGLQNSDLEYVYQIRNPDEAVEFWTKTFCFCVQACAIPKEKREACNKTFMDNQKN